MAIEGLKEPLSQAQIEAANRLYQLLEQWQLSDRALHRLHGEMPTFDVETCLLKSLAINQLYGTRILAIIPMSRHVDRILKRADLTATGIELVDEIAAFRHKEKLTNNTAFAAKFCHFFVDEERFPIYDEQARRAIRADSAHIEA